MSIARGLMGSVVGGLVGVTAWAAVSYFFHYEVGWLAWAVGVLAGVGMAAAGGRGAPAGLLAAVVALASVAGGKFLAVHFEVARMVREGPDDFTEEDAQYAMMRNLMEAYIQEGRYEPLADDEGFPVEVFDEVEARWADMSDDERAEAVARAREAVRRGYAASADELHTAGFIMSFGPFDIAWVFFAVTSAFKIGSAKQQAGQHLNEELDLPGGSGPLDRYAPRPADRVASSCSPLGAADRFRIPGAPPAGHAAAPPANPGSRAA